MAHFQTHRNGLATAPIVASLRGYTPPTPDAVKACHTLSLQRSFADCRVIPAAAPMSAHDRPKRRALAVLTRQVGYAVGG